MLAGSSHELQLQLTAQDIIHIEKLMHLNASYNITCEADPNVESGEHSTCLATLLQRVSGHIARHLLAGLTYPGSSGHLLPAPALSAKCIHIIYIINIQFIIQPGVHLLIKLYVFSILAACCHLGTSWNR